MSNQRDQTILEMCRSYRSDYDLKKQDSDPPWLLGLTDSERQGLWRTMEHIYDTEIATRANNETTTITKPKKGHQRKVGQSRGRRTTARRSD